MNPRILVVDDMASIHEDFRKIFAPPRHDPTLAHEEELLFGDSTPPEETLPFDVDSAFQGREAVDKVIEARAQGRPYALAFVDMRMPPGWDGLETTEHLWEHDSELQVVICTAYSDLAWPQLHERLAANHRVALLRKPFEPREAVALARALAAARPPAADAGF